MVFLSLVLSTPSGEGIPFRDAPFTSAVCTMGLSYGMGPYPSRSRLNSPFGF
ncbi:MAG: hypothetical protein QHH30_06115 [candidate division NC10 bacterium]|nr:hypothetical protein [candidate division NC10 bacterium]